MSSGASALFSHKLTDFAPWNQESEGDLSGQLVLFLDDSLLTSYHHSGSFAMDSLLLKYCRSPEHKVVILLSSQSSNHYQSILMKNLIDVHTMCGSDRLQCYHLVTEMLRSSNEEILPWQSSNALTPSKSTVSNWSQELSWDDLIHWQDRFLDSQHGPEGESSANSNLKPIVFIDDLDAFELLAPSPAAARLFIKRFSRALQNGSSSLNSLVSFGRLRNLEESSLNNEIVAVGADVNNTKALSSLHINQQEPLLTTYLLAHAQWVIVAAALRTGLSSLVHGTLTIQQVDFLSDRPGKRKQVLQYRALDSGVQCVASE